LPIAAWSCINASTVDQGQARLSESATYADLSQDIPTEMQAVGLGGAGPLVVADLARAGAG
jgi:hypothetical protein